MVTRDYIGRVKKKRTISYKSPRASEPAVLREDFHTSLVAAYTPQEVRLHLAAPGLAGLEVRRVSDRHWLAAGRLP